MTDTAWIVAASVVGTALLIVLTMIGVALVMTLSEVRMTARRVRELIERVGPDVELSAANLREVSTSAVRGAQSVERLAVGLTSLRMPSPGRTGGWAMIIAATTALFAALRRRRERRDDRRR
jgi:signal transduction histidine kinase